MEQEAATAVCPSCDGEGWDMYDGHADRDCQVCSGRGVVPIASLEDADLIRAYQQTDGEPGNPAADALLAEIEHRDLDL